MRKAVGGRQSPDDQFDDNMFQNIQRHLPSLAPRELRLSILKLGLCVA